MVVNLEGPLAELAQQAKAVGWSIKHTARDDTVRWFLPTGEEKAAHSPHPRGRILKSLTSQIQKALEGQYRDLKIMEEAEAQVAGQKTRRSPAVDAMIVRVPEDVEVSEELQEEDLASISPPKEEIGPRFTVRFADIPVEKIKAADIDHGGYQRPPGADHALGLALEFSWDDFDRVSVSERDGYYFILDGQHRLLALELTDRVPDDKKQSVPAVIYSGMTLADESRYYLRKNTGRKNTHSIHAWKARLVGEEKVRSIENIATKNGYKIGTGGTGYLTAIKALEIIWDDFGSEVLDSVLATTAEAWGPEQRLSAPVIRGLGFVLGLYDIQDRSRLIRIMQQQTSVAFHAKARFAASASEGVQMIWVARILVASYNSKLAPNKTLGDFDTEYAKYLSERKANPKNRYFETYRQKVRPTPGSWLESSRQY